MNWSTQQILYFFLSTISFILLALFAAEANFLPEMNWLVGTILAVFLIIHFYFLFKKREKFYELNIQNKGLLYSQAIALFVLELISFINAKEDFLNSAHTIELFKWMIMLGLFMSIIRVIRPLSFDEW